MAIAVSFHTSRVIRRWRLKERKKEREVDMPGSVEETRLLSTIICIYSLASAALNRDRDSATVLVGEERGISAPEFQLYKYHPTTVAVWNRILTGILVSLENYQCMYHS